MNILVTGANGQLGKELTIVSKAYPYRMFFTDVDTLDITNINSVSDYIRSNSINAVINCAAYTAVDKAEEEPDKATLINKTAVSYLAELAKQYSLPLIHMSTDFVFDGKKTSPYFETDQTNPLSVYGRSKLEGELEIIKTAPTYAIIRTSWLYSEFGNNFVKTIIRLTRERKELNVVSDQTGSPTYAKDLAEAIMKIITKLKPGTKEIFNYSNKGVASWYEFAKEIVTLSKIDCAIKPIGTKDYPTPATRPAYSVLDKSKIKEYFGLDIPNWRDSLRQCINKL
jgi:dTDP-4-dehydrorhamnose reductase